MCNIILHINNIFYQFVSKKKKKNILYQYV